jgi:hypothetical protein
VQAEVKSAILEAARRQVEQALSVNGHANEAVQRVLRGEITVHGEAHALMEKAVMREV